jgi:hypothetical protein
VNPQIPAQDRERSSAGRPVRLPYRVGPRSNPATSLVTDRTTPANPHPGPTRHTSREPPPRDHTRQPGPVQPPTQNRPTGTIPEGSYRNSGESPPHGWRVPGVAVPALPRDRMGRVLTSGLVTDEEVAVDRVGAGQLAAGQGALVAGQGALPSTSRAALSSARAWSTVRLTKVRHGDQDRCRRSASARPATVATRISWSMNPERTWILT